MVRHRRLRETQLGGQLRHIVDVGASIFGWKQRENSQAHPIGERFELTGQKIVGQWLPGVRLGRGAAGAGEDLVELLQQRVVELDLERLQRCRRAAPCVRGPMIGAVTTGVVQQPGQRDVGGLLAELVAEPSYARASGRLLRDRASADRRRGGRSALLVLRARRRATRRRAGSTGSCPRP